MTSVLPRRHGGLLLAVGAAVVVADQASKTWAEHALASRTVHIIWTLRLRLTLNPGIAFSLGQGSTGLFTALAVAIFAVVAGIAWRSRGRLPAVALGLILGGAGGNLVDRLIRHNGGQVIDFIDLQWWPVFNVADAAIVVGVVLLAVAFVRRPAPVAARDH
jgi:signal peptidase II